MKNKSIKKIRRISPPGKKGMAPGTQIYTGTNIMESSIIEIITYTDESVTSIKPSLQELVDLELTDEKMWININGISNEKYIRAICDKFGVHYLYQEDIMNVFQRPKVEDETNYIFITFKSLEWREETKCIEEEQFSFILLENIVITFQEKEGDNFESMREKLHSKNLIIRDRSIDYVFYRLMDITVDNYFEILEKLGNYLEEIEAGIISYPSPDDLLNIQNNKKDIMQLRKNIYPLRDVLNRLINAEHHLIKEPTKKYFKDVLDHTIQVLETVETFREINVSLKDVYLNTLSHEMNRIMKVLTIISTFFIWKINFSVV